MTLRLPKRLAAALFPVLLILGLAARPAPAVELHAYVGAGLRPPVDALIATFQKETGVTVTAEYGGSGQLLARANETKQGDLFIPCSALYTDKLAEQGATLSVRALVAHGPVLAVSTAKADSIRSVADLAKPGVRVGLGDVKAMALGRTAEEILDKSGVGDAVHRNVTVRAATVKQLTLYLLDGDVDAAIIGASEVAQHPGKFAVVPIPPEWYPADVATVAVLKTSAAPQEAERFAAYLASDAGLAVFRRFGFPPAPKR